MEPGLAGYCANLVGGDSCWDHGDSKDGKIGFSIYFEGEPVRLADSLDGRQRN